MEQAFKKKRFTSEDEPLYCRMELHSAMKNNFGELFPVYFESLPELINFLLCLERKQLLAYLLPIGLCLQKFEERLASERRVLNCFEVKKGKDVEYYLVWELSKIATFVWESKYFVFHFFLDFFSFAVFINISKVYWTQDNERKSVEKWNKEKQEKEAEN